MVDVDEDGAVIGIETIGKPLSVSDLWACLVAARFPRTG
jgi:hypothetical protein